MKETVRAFVEGWEGGFVPFNRGSLPVVSGIALIMHIPVIQVDHYPQRIY